MSEKDKKGASGTSKRITVHDVARHADVAIGTVSRVVNDAPGVSADIRQRVLDAIEALGWVPSVAAQSMRGISSRMVGFIFADIRKGIAGTLGIAQNVQPVHYVQGSNLAGDVASSLANIAGTAFGAKLNPNVRKTG